MPWCRSLWAGQLDAFDDRPQELTMPCRNQNKKTGRFQKRKTANTKRVCYPAAGRKATGRKASGRKAVGRKARAPKQCRVQRGPRKGQFKKCR